MGTETEQSTQVHGGRLVARRLKAHGVTKLFTLSGGHLFSIYDGCRAEGIDLVDTRHEQAAAFAAEGWAKVTRQPGVAALTAGPGVTNGMSALGSAQQNGSPLVVLGGRAPAMRWGQGSLQEVDHVPFVAPLTKSAVTAQATSEIPGLIDDALRTALEPHPGPAFVDFPLDVVFMEAPGGEDEASPHDPAAEPAAVGPDLERAVALLRGARRPVIMAGTGLWWGHGERALRALAEELRVPVFLNGLARGVVPADHELFFSRARGKGLQEADVALVVGVPMDFRLAFGQAFGADTELVVVDRAPAVRPHPRPVAAELLGGVGATLDALREGVGAALPTQGWVDGLRAAEDEKRAAEQAQLGDGRSPLHPVRLYKELGEVLDRNAVVVGDGGDFVSYAGRFIDSYEPGCWLDPGPFGCLGAGPGYALAAKLAHPDRQVVLLLGDGAFGFSGMEYDTLARHGVDVVGVMGNNGIWALEKHPMEFLYGYSVAAELRPGTRYDRMVEALGGHGELVERPEDVKGALERAFGAGRPALVNVLTDPSVVYPRKSNLA
jgi:acetolactate synthase-1/2/3 large subunit